MTIKELHDLNEKFQKEAVQLSELIPSGGLTNATSMMIRSARKIHGYFEKLVYCETENQFSSAINKMDYYMDEIIFVLDQMEVANRKQQIRLIKDFLKNGYDLLSIYSMCVDQIIQEKIKTEEQ